MPSASDKRASKRSSKRASKTSGKTVFALAAPAQGANFERTTIQRRATGPDDVSIDIKYAGICHSDLSQARGEWGTGIFPMVPGHEIVGVVSEVGENVTKFKPGDRVGVGCLVDSCMTCKQCSHGNEQYCRTGGVQTYNHSFLYDRADGDFGKTTYGGYSSGIVVREHFVMKVPDTLDLAAAAPLLCAGITTFSPIVHYGLRANQRLAVVGLGGLGYMAARFGKAFGAHVTIISRGNKKREDALEMGADDFVDSTNPDEMAKVTSSFDMIINTVGVQHDPNPYINTLDVDGVMVMVGASPSLDIGTFGLIAMRRRVVGSMIGGMDQTQECLDFCARHGITCKSETILPEPEAIDEAYQRMLASDVKYRFVIDMTKAE